VDGESANGGEEDNRQVDEEEQRFQARAQNRGRRREVDKVIGLLKKASATEKGYATESDFIELFRNHHGGEQPQQNNRLIKNHRLDVIDEADRMMRETLGVEVIHDIDCKPARFYLRNLPDDQLSEELLEAVKARELGKSAEDKYKDGVLYTALMFIFMSKRHGIVDGPGVPRKVLEELLANTFGLQSDAFANLFGPAKSAEFVKKGFIKATIACQGGSTMVEDYDWGTRAEKVVDKKKVMEDFCGIYGSKVYAWPMHAQVAGFDERAIQRMKMEDAARVHRTPDD